MRLLLRHGLPLTPLQLGEGVLDGQHVAKRVAGGLPHVTGAELAALLSQTDRWAHLPIIYLSAESNSELRNQALLRGGDAFLEKPVDRDLLVRLCAARIQRLRELERTRNRDGLTGLLKHASIKEALQMQWQLAQRRPQTFSVAMLDIDHFKAINDTYGHSVGDTVIAAVGTLLRQHFRITDKLGRYGGEEFTLVLPDCDADQVNPGRRNQYLDQQINHITLLRILILLRKTQDHRMITRKAKNPNTFPKRRLTEDIIP